MTRAAVPSAGVLLAGGAMLTAAMVLAACTGSLFTSKAAPSAIYLLSANAAATPGVATPGVATPGVATPGMAAQSVVAADLAVLQPRVRAGLETDRIAVLYPDRRLDYFAAAHWSGPLDSVVQDLAVQAFHAGAHLRNVSVDASAFASGYWLEIEVADFQAEYTPAAAAPIVHVQLLARIGSAADRHVLGTFDASARQPATDNRLTAIVDAYERAADAALAQIVADTVGTINDHLEHR